MTLDLVDTTNEVAVITFLQSGVAALSEALDRTDIAGVVNIKAQAATVETATKQLGLSQESQDVATELVRRSEWTLGRALKKGQAEGVVSTRADNPGPRREYERNGYTVQPSEKVNDETKVSVDSLIGSGRTRAEILSLADIEPEQFETALAEARDEGNVSRANVVRKVGIKPMRSQPRDSAETYLNLIEMQAAKAAREVQNLTPDQIRRVRPKADLWTVGLRKSIEVLQHLVDSLDPEENK